MLCELRRIGLAVLLLAVVAACAEFPKPFKPDDKLAVAPPLLKLNDSAGIVLRPVEGVAPEVSDRLRAAMVEALARNDVPATLGPGNAASYGLDARIASLRLGGRTRFLILWALRDAAGRTVGEHLQQEKAEGDALTAGDAGLFAAVAERAAPIIAAFIQEPVQAVPPPAPVRAVTVLPVEGAPGDGRTSLARALRFYLGQTTLEPVEALVDDAPVVLGTVTVGPARGGVEPVSILWLVLGPDGEEIGRIDQNNDLPAGLLDGKWGEIAFMVAEGAAAGIQALLERPAP